MKKKIVKKPTDAKLRNIRAANKRRDKILEAIKELHGDSFFVRTKLLSLEKRIAKLEGR